MHHQSAIALDHDNPPRWLRDHKPERQWQREAHRILEIEIFRRVTHDGPQVGSVAERRDNESVRRQRFGERPIIVGPARAGINHH